MSEDTHILLREYIREIMDEREKNVNYRFEAAKEALMESKKELDKKLAELNQLRRDVETDRDVLVKKETYEIEYTALVKRVDWNQKIIFMGLGALIVLEFILRYAKI